MTTPIDPHDPDLAALPADQRLDEVIRRMKALTEEGRVDVIKAFACHDERFASKLLVRTVSKPQIIEDCVAEAIANANASSIRDWLNVGSTRLGFRRMCRVLMRADRGTMEKAIYWMPMLLPPDEPKAAEVLAELTRIVRGG